MGFIRTMRKALSGHTTSDGFAASVATLIAHEPVCPSGNFYRP